MDYRRYFQRLGIKTEEKKNMFPRRYVFSHSGNNYYADAISRQGYRYNFVISSDRSRTYGSYFQGLIVELYIGQNNHDSYFNQLLQFKERIEEELNEENIVWQPSSETPSGNVCRIYAKRSVDIDDESKWDEYIDWQINTMIKFLKTLPKYVNRLNDIGVVNMIDYNGFKEYMIRIGFAPNGIQTYMSYINENKLDILNNIPAYQNLNDIDKLKKFAESDSSFQETFNQYHSYANESTFNDLRSGARRYVLYMMYHALLETMNNYKESPESFDLNGAYMFFKIFNNHETYPVKSICRRNKQILELPDSFTTDNCKSKLTKIFNHKNNNSNIIFIKDRDDNVETDSRFFNSSIANIILYGSPGVGKTHNTKKLISLIESRILEKEIFDTITNNVFNDSADANNIVDNISNRVKFITFHQSFGYEDFIEGFRPNENGNIKLQDGIFKSICDDANNDRDHNYYLVIDEINRGNISKIFGELITLIEEDKRDIFEVTLPYSKEPFKIPSNLYIIGTMNSTDKSIALIDIALRRRFTFLKMEPNSELVTYPKAKALFIELNKKIEEKLGKEYILGHSYFMNIANDSDLSFVLEYKIKPLLEEYFYGDGDGYNEVIAIIEEI